MEYEEKKKSPLASPVGTEREEADRIAALRRASDKDVEDAWEEAADAEYRASSEALAGLTSWAERALSASGLERRTGRKASAVAFFGADGRIAVSLHMFGVESPATLSFGFPKPGKNGFFRDDSAFRGRLGELPRRSAGTESERKAERDRAELEAWLLGRYEECRTAALYAWKSRFGAWNAFDLCRAEKARRDWESDPLNPRRKTVRER